MVTNTEKREKLGQNVKAGEKLHNASIPMPRNMSQLPFKHIRGGNYVGGFQHKFPQNNGVDCNNPMNLYIRKIIGGGSSRKITGLKGVRERLSNCISHPLVLVVIASTHLTHLEFLFSCNRFLK